MSALFDHRRPALLLSGAFLLSAAIKLVNLHSGGPQIEIDDYTLYNGAFSIWFGNAPPQHMYVESWLCGIVCMLTYGVKTALQTGVSGLVSINVVADAYRDYTQTPDTYYAAYKAFVLLVDLATAFIVYRIAKLVLPRDGWAPSAVFVTVLYLFSYNTVWSGLVGRPDIFVGFCGALGLYLYFRAEYDVRSPYFWGAATALGFAAGFKLHGAFFAVFVALDLLRVWGVRRAIVPIVVFGLVSSVFFAVSAGTLLFDPLLYVKLRLLNYSDDVSTHLKWGGQLLTLLKGTGWVLLPIVLLSTFLSPKGVLRESSSRIKSVLLLSVCWLLLFISIRQLRAYWMLPALPVFYLLVAYLLGRIAQSTVRQVAVTALVIVFVAQSAYEAVSLRGGGHDELRSYVANNIGQDQSFFVLGYSILVLPRSTENIHVASAEITGRIQRTPEADERFTYRHVKNWEEASQLLLFDMLDFRSDRGYDYYNFYDHEPGFFVELMAASKPIAYVILADGFPLSSYPEVEQLLKNNFVLDAERRGPGGGGRGMRYMIYKKAK